MTTIGPRLPDLTLFASIDTPTLATGLPSAMELKAQVRRSGRSPWSNRLLHIAS
jgi:hypothetical protein